MTSSQGPRPGAPDALTDETDELVGRVLDDRYLLEERIGSGGMGQVYRARHLRMDQAVAVKVLHPDLSADPTAARRFAREARHTFRFDHPHCVRVIDFGATPEGTLYLVMEYLTGRTAAQEIAVDGPMAPERVLHIARQVCDALAYAHGLGLVHRDIKPENLMLLHRGGDPDFVKVLDFGLAKLFGEGAAHTAAFSAFALTREGSVFGTAEYMSPEQAMDQPLAPTADVYSLGVTMYELVTATLPFEGRTFTEVLAQQVQKQPVPPAARRPDLAIPAPLNGLILACMAKHPGHRPQSAEALAAEIDRVAHRRIAHERAPASGGAHVPATTVAAAETVDLHAMRDPALADTAAALPAGAAGATLPRARGVPPASTVPTAQTRAHGRRPGARAIAIALALAALAATGLALALRARTAGHARAPAPPATPAALATATPAPDDPALPARATRATGGDVGPAPAALPAAHGAGAPTPDLPPATGAHGDEHGARDRATGAHGDEHGEHGARDRASAAPDPDPREGDAQRARRRDVARHLAAAQEARKRGNRLKQMAEADSALRLDRGNDRAAFLLGDALVASGDEQNGCKYLRRARDLAEARAALRRAHCPDD